jgi:catechol 2,3-dioxygenase-like lactoylglutathione lyase family enzyme
MITGLDHVIILVNNLNTAIETYRGLGFDVQPGGEHPAFGSHDALIALSDGTYFELVAFRDTALAARTFWSEAVRRLGVREGYDGYAVRSDDIAADVQRLRRQGLKIDDPQPGERIRPDGRRVAWLTARWNPALSSILPFLIQDDAPRELRVPPPEGGLGSHARLKEIVIAVKNPEVARGAFRDLTDVEARLVHNTSGELQGYRVTLPWGSVVLAHPERGSNAFADQLAQRGEGVYAVTLAVDDVNRARIEMKRHNLSVQDDPNGFLILPSTAHGARIRFVQA